MERLRKATVIVAVLALLLAAAVSVAGCSGATPSTPSGGSGTGTTATPSTGSGSGSSGSSGSSEDAQALMIKACTTCHGTARIYLEPQNADWAAIIDRMQKTHMQPGMFGATISDEQKAAIIQLMMSRVPSAGEDVVRTKCVQCHDLARIMAKPVGTDWASVVSKMVQSHGLVLTAEEQKLALDFLSGK